MPFHASTPRQLVRFLHDRSADARAEFRQFLHAPVARLIGELIERHTLRYHGELLTRHALQSAEIYLRTCGPSQFEGLSWGAFQASLLLYVAKLATSPSVSMTPSGGPGPLPHCPAYQSQICFLPSERIGDSCFGGDWFGGVRARDGALWVLVADVTGHGLCAHLLASSLPHVWRHCWEQLPPDCDQPVALLEKIHNLLDDCLPEGIYVEATLGRFRPDGVAILVAAGGGRLLMRNGGHGHVTLHTLRGSWLGLAPPHPDDQQAWRLGVGDEILLGSDGVFDQMTAHGRFSEVLGQLLANAQASRRWTLFDAVQWGLQEAFQTHPQEDDITMVQLRRLREHLAWRSAYRVLKRTVYGFTWLRRSGSRNPVPRR